MNPVLLGIGGWGITTLATLAVVIIICRGQIRYWQQRALAAEKANTRLRARRQTHYLAINDTVSGTTQQLEPAVTTIRLPGYDHLSAEYAATRHQRTPNKEALAWSTRSTS
jgi:hypothetical protein